MQETIIHAMFQAIDDRQWDVLDKLFDERIVYDRPGYDSFVGLEHVLDFYRSTRRISGSHHITQLFLDEAGAACFGRFIGVGKEGEAIDEAFADMYIFADGKVIERRTYFYRPAI